MTGKTHGERMPQRPRMQDIADVTGFTVKTVSRALSGEPNVRATTREAVLAEAMRIGFQRNDIAAGLRRTGQRMSTVGVMLSDLSNPFFPPLLRGIHAVAAEHGFPIIVAEAAGDASLERAAIEGLLAQRVSGLIVAPTGTDFAYLANELHFGSVLVFVDSTPLGSAADTVTTANDVSTHEVIAGLIARGHRRIAFLGHPDAGYGAPLRWEGYLAALREAGIEPDMSIVRRGLTAEAEATAAVDAIFAGEDLPTAVFADNNRLTVGILKSGAYARHAFAMASFDSLDFADQFGVTTIDSRPLEVGRAGAELFFRRLAAPELPPLRAHVEAHIHWGGTPLFVPA